MNGLPKTGDLFATNQVSPDTERCYRYQDGWFHSGLKAFGWLTNSSIRALEKLSQLEKDTAKNELDLVAAMSEPVEDGDDGSS